MKYLENASLKRFAFCTQKMKISTLKEFGMKIVAETMKTPNRYQTCQIPMFHLLFMHHSCN